MLYFDLSEKKTLTLFAIVMGLLVCVATTFYTKEELYGESRFDQIFSRTLSDGYRSLMYNFRNGGMFGGLLANVRTDTYVSSHLKAEAIPVLTYHAIITAKNSEKISPESFEGHNVALAEFEQQMFTLKEAGWETVSLTEFTEFMKGERELPQKSFLLTFDDGSKESYYPVDPILRSLDYEAVSFILPQYSAETGTYYYLSENEISRAIKSGRWAIGSHGFDTHKFVAIDESGKEGAALANRQWLSDEARLETDEEYRRRVNEDMALSQAKLEQMFGTEIRTFAFPFGDFGQTGSNFAGADEFIPESAASLYDFSFYQWWEGEGFTFNFPDSEQHMVKRINVQPSWSGQYLLGMLERGTPKNLPYTDEFDQDQGWLTTWGDFVVSDSRLLLAAARDSSGASLILDGSQHWRDYNIRMKANSPRGTGFSVLVRFKDNDNHAVCNIGNGFAHVEQVVNGEHRVIKGNRAEEIVVPEGPFTVDVVVSDRSVTCAVNGTVLVDTAFLDESLERGGIGLKVWDRAIGTSVLSVDKLDVTAPTDS